MDGAAFGSKGAEGAKLPQRVFVFHVPFCSLPPGNAVDICHPKLFGDFSVPSSQGPKGDFRHKILRFCRPAEFFVQCLSDRREAVKTDLGNSLSSS